MKVLYRIYTFGISYWYCYFIEKYVTCFTLCLFSFNVAYSPSEVDALASPLHCDRSQGSGSEAGEGGNKHSIRKELQKNKSKFAMSGVRGVIHLERGRLEISNVINVVRWSILHKAYRKFLVILVNWGVTTGSITSSILIWYRFFLLWKERLVKFALLCIPHKRHIMFVFNRRPIFSL